MAKCSSSTCFQYPLLLLHLFLCFLLLTFVSIIVSLLFFFFLSFLLPDLILISFHEYRRVLKISDLQFNPKIASAVIPPDCFPTPWPFDLRQLELHVLITLLAFVVILGTVLIALSLFATARFLYRIFNRTAPKKEETVSAAKKKSLKKD